jgi:hypothetical protein
MATYTELRAIIGSADGDDLKKKIEVAIVIKAQTLVDGTPSPGQLTWASEALDAPSSKVSQVMNYMIASNNTAAVAAITGATDATIQTNCDAAVDALVS